MKYLIIIVVGLILTATSCNKRGCTNPVALNYSPSATKNDNSCIFPSYIRIRSVRIEFDSINPSTGEKWDNTDGPDVFCAISNASYQAGQFKFFSTDTSYNISSGIFYSQLGLNDYVLTPPQIWEDGSWHFEDLYFNFRDFDDTTSETIGHYIFPLSTYTNPNSNKSFPKVITEDNLIDFGENLPWKVRIEVDWL